MKFTNDGFELRSNPLFLKIGIVATVMECGAFYFFIPMFLEFDGSFADIADVIGAAFICLWLGVVFCGALYSFFKYSQKLFVREDGVLYTSIFGRRHLCWNEIKDYGLSYDGRVRDGGDFSNSYILYFATEKQSDKNKFKKKLLKKALKISVSSNDYAWLLENVFPFCKSRIAEQPFVPEDVPHFI